MIIVFDIFILLIFWFVFGLIKINKLRIFLRAGILAITLMPSFQFSGESNFSIDLAWAHIIDGVVYRNLTFILEAGIPVLIVWLTLIIVGTKLLKK